MIICTHEDRVSVRSIEGEVVSNLCLLCDEQLDAAYVPGGPHPPVRIDPSAMVEIRDDGKRGKRRR